MKHDSHCEKRGTGWTRCYCGHRAATAASGNRGPVGTSAVIAGSAKKVDWRKEVRTGFIPGREDCIWISDGTHHRYLTPAHAADLACASSAGRKPIVVRPDVVGDFTAMPFPDDTFYLVVLDPPHHTAAWFGSGCSIMKNSYGMLLPGWEEILRRGFEEAFRVLKTNGTLIFKWGDREIPLSRVLALTDRKPLFGSRSSKNAHWIAFLKQNVPGQRRAEDKR